MDKSSKIPRIIHYCWFGRGIKPKLFQKCMKSWKKHLPEYQFVEWNEDNFDVDSIKYVKQAYEVRKFAFVSDYVRLHALYHYGGIYMDTDVEVLKPLDRFLGHEAFSGFEDDIYLQSGTMGAQKNNPWIKEMLEYYSNKSFIKLDQTYDITTNTNIITNICLPLGLVQNGKYQELKNGVVFYPRTFFSPYDYIDGKSYLTDESYTIHHFAQTWLPRSVRIRSKMKRIINHLIGSEGISFARKILNGK